MSDPTAAVPSAKPAASSFVRTIFDYLRGDGLVPRSILLTLLVLFLKLPLGFIGDLVTDRQTYQGEAEKNVTGNWGRSQTFVGPLIELPYRSLGESGSPRHTMTLLPERLTVNGTAEPEQRRRGLFAVTVYAASLDVVAEFPIKALRDAESDGRWIDFTAARLTVGLSDIKSINIAPVDIDGRPVDWSADTGSSALASLQAALGSYNLRERDTVTIRFRVAFNGSGSLSMVPVGRRTEVSFTSPWTSPSFFGRYLPSSQAIDSEGFRAKWSVPPLGRGYSQLWESANSSNSPSAGAVRDTAFGFTLINPVDAYRETDRAIKYALLVLGLTFAVCQMFELSTNMRPSMAQYGLIGLSLSVFYLLLLSFSERIGFGPAYVVSAGAVVLQASAYNLALHRRWDVALAFGGILAGLYAGLYTLLRLEDVALLCGSVLLFALLSLAMWLTRNLHRLSPVRA
ncbi:MAG: cell envelope integrity protein CreD [Alphaproteobacteria bacterium]|nr:cell envelope integrity protein CreD [Alphaproteobacteria bacterium]